jgi:nucleotide-binding universal stress UspA family protein
MESSTPIKRIVVAFDGSDMAKRAFAYAVMLAERVKAKVVVLHVQEVAAPIQAAKASTMLAGDMEFIAAPDDEGERRKRTRAIDEEFEDRVDYCWDRQVEFEGSHR